MSGNFSHCAVCGGPHEPELCPALPDPLSAAVPIETLRATVDLLEWNVIRMTVRCGDHRRAGRGDMADTLAKEIQKTKAVIEELKTAIA